MKGFTLIEVMVALLVAATALAAGIRATTGIVEREAALDARRAAGWLVSDRVAELRARRAFPPPGSNQGEAEQAGYRLHWRETVDGTPHPRFRRLRVEVSEAPDGPALASLTAMLYGGRP